MKRYLKYIMMIIAVMLLANTVMLLAAQETNGRVLRMAATLNVRTAPTTGAEIVAEIEGSTPLIVTGRTATSSWLAVQTTDGISGWVSTRFVTLEVPLASLPVVNAGGAVVEAPSTEDEVITSVPAVAPTTGAQAVIDIGLGLNLRTEASLSGEIIRVLPGGELVGVLNSSEDGSWLQVQTSTGETGWVAARFVTVSSVVDAAAAVPSTTTSTTSTASAGTSITPTNAASQLFAKVGDSISESPLSYEPIAFAPINYGPFGSLRPVVERFNGDSNNAFTRRSMAVGNGWTSATLLDPNAANTEVCLSGETPLECEYRVTGAGVAIILIGTNDVAELSVDAYIANINEIIRISRARGVVPAFGTIPMRLGFDVGPYNRALTSVTVQQGVPLWDYGGAMNNLANFGLSADGVHPSGNSVGSVVDFTAVNQGYTLFNLRVLQTLNDLILRGIIR